MSSRSIINRAMVVAGAAAALTLATSGIASAATTISPAGTTINAHSDDLLFVTTGGLELECFNVGGSGTIPASPGNTNSGTGGVTVPISTVTMGDCWLAGAPATVTTSGTWSLNANKDSGTPKGTLSIPNGGVVVKSGACTITVNATTTPALPFDNLLHKVTATSAGPINFTSNGGTAACPAAGPGTATMTGDLTFPGVTIT